MTKCIVFNEDISNLTAQQLHERCSGCLEGGENCKWIETTNEEFEYTYHIIGNKNKPKEEDGWLYVSSEAAITLFKRKKI